MNVSASDRFRDVRPTHSASRTTCGNVRTWSSGSVASIACNSARRASVTVCVLEVLRTSSRAAVAGEDRKGSTDGVGARCGSLPHRRRDTGDRQPGWRIGRADRRDGNPLPDRIAVTEKAFHEPLVDDDRRHAGCAVLGGELPSANQRQAECSEVSRRDGESRHRLVLLGVSRGLLSMFRRRGSPPLRGSAVASDTDAIVGRAFSRSVSIM